MAAGVWGREEQGGAEERGGGGGAGGGGSGGAGGGAEELAGAPVACLGGLERQLSESGVWVAQCAAPALLRSGEAARRRGEVLSQA